MTKDNAVNTREPLLTLQEVSKLFKLLWGRGKLRALDHMDLTVYKGEIFGLLGPNGSGKSTTMKLMLGLLRPTTGEIRIAGHPAGSIEAKEKIGFLPENPYFPQFLSAKEVLEFYGPLCGLHGEKLEARSNELLKLVGLDTVAGRTLRAFSKGMLQRIGLAQALLSDPEILLLDEPTAGVDPIGSRQIRDIMLELRSRGKTIIFSSHLLEQVQEVADRVAILHLGKKVCEGTLEELLTKQDETQINLKDASPALLSELETLLKRHNITSKSLRKPQVKLEDFFIQLVTKK